MTHEIICCSLTCLTGSGGVRSEPPGLFVEPGTQERVRVWVKTSCCTPFIKILSISPYNTELNACVLDVRGKTIRKISKNSLGFDINQ